MLPTPYDLVHLYSDSIQTFGVFQDILRYQSKSWGAGQHWLDLDNIEVAAIRYRGTTIAACVIQRQAQGWYVVSLHVNSLHRRKGLAEHMLNYLHDQHQDKPFELTVDVRNGGALRLYKTLGYYQIGHRLGYYTNSDGFQLRREP